MKILSSSVQKNQNLQKICQNIYINFQIWFPKYKSKNSKYIKNVEVHSLRTPVLEAYIRIECITDTVCLNNINMIATVSTKM